MQDSEVIRLLFAHKPITLYAAAQYAPALPAKVRLVDLRCGCARLL